MSHQLNDLQRLRCPLCASLIKCFRNDVDPLVEHMNTFHPNILKMTDVKCKPGSSLISLLKNNSQISQNKNKTSMDGAHKKYI